MKDIYSVLFVCCDLFDDIGNKPYKIFDNEIKYPFFYLHSEYYCNLNESIDRNDFIRKIKSQNTENNSCLFVF